MLKEIGRVAVFIICAQTLLHFRAKESYEKYIKLLISMMVLLLLLKPFLNGGFGTEGDIFAEMVAKYEKELESGMFLHWNQEEMEAVVVNMAQEVVSQEGLQESCTQNYENVEETMEEKGEEQAMIQVERIQIGE